MSLRVRSLDNAWISLSLFQPFLPCTPTGGWRDEKTGIQPHAGIRECLPTLSLALNLADYPGRQVGSDDDGSVVNVDVRKRQQAAG